MACFSSFSWLDTDNLKNILVPLMQVIGPFLAAGIVLFQINRNHTNSIRLAGEKTKDELKAKLHAEIEEKLQKLSDAISDAQNMFNNIGFTFAAIRGRQVNPQFSYTPKDIIALKAAVANAAIGVVFVIEKYEIIQPEIKIFQTALNVYLYDLQQADMQLFTELLAILPFDVAAPAPAGYVAGQRIHKPLPNEATMQRVEQFFMPYTDALLNLGSVIHDFRIDIQNLLLSKLFGRKLPPRKPLDPRFKVITTEPKTVKALNEYFDNQTAWGRNTRETTERVTRILNAQAAAQNTTPAN